MSSAVFPLSILGIAAILSSGLVSCERTQNTPTLPTASPIPPRLEVSPTLSGKNALFHANEIVKIGDRSPGSPGAKQQRAYLAKELKRCGWTVSEQSFDKNTSEGTWNFVNVRARFGTTPGSVPAPGIISCHIDTKTGIPGFVGANDGASGAALILELARILQSRPELAKQIELVFFDGEESVGLHMTFDDGLYGSTYYVDQMSTNHPQWLINLDMVGRQGMKIRIPADTNQKMYELYSRGIRELNLNPMTWGVASGMIMDDHLPFMKKGIPCINIIDDFTDGSWWHTANDSIEILDEESFLQSGRMTLFLIENLIKQ